MEKHENEKICTEEGVQLNRNRSFKSKQLVRSQAIRETQSPPRTVSPCVNETVKNNDKNNVTVVNVITDDARTLNVSSDDSSQTNSDNYSEKCCLEQKQQVEIQITPGNWEEPECEHSHRPRRWSNNKSDNKCADLLSHSPRVTCVCGACACPHCRGRRRQHQCPTKQDSGIVCDRDDASDTDIIGSLSTIEPIRKSSSLDDELMCRCPERRERKSVNTIVRADSAEDKSDLSGAELVKFIKDTLNKNPRDRLTLLKIERELHELVNDNGRCVVRFPAMSSYGRLLVHRVATLFQLAHRLDPINRSGVLVSKTGTSGGQLPCTQFKQWCSTAFPDIQQHNNNNNINITNTNSNTNAKSILKRATQSLEDAASGTFSANRSKSLEQREKEYERVRSRIFSEENCPTDESQWPWLSSGPVKVLAPEGGRKLLKVQSLEVEGSWRRGAVHKSHSFAGEHPTRALSKQGDLASSSWRLSPSSSGYKTLSLRSTDSITPSPTGGASPEPCSASLLWAVTDYSRVPVGALVIHPQTGRPLTNPDGSVYHFDPRHPPVIYDANTEPADVTQIQDNNDKRRGRLQKQHSFMDNECECQPPSTEETSKCCCECKIIETQRQCEKPQQSQQTTKPQTPTKTHNTNTPKTITTESTNHEPETNKQIEPTKHKAIYEPPKNISTNQRPPSYDYVANQRPSSGSRNKLSNQSSQDLHYMPQNYLPYRNDELTSPHQMINQMYVQPDMTSLHPAIQAKCAPVLHDPNMRPMLTNVIYPAPMPTNYPYINQYRPDQQAQPLYHQPISDPKQLTAQHSDNNTFRIDPSYPYPAVDYSQCGPCAYVDTQYNNAHRPGYNMGYGQMEVPNMMSANMYQQVVLPPTHYPYQDVVQYPPPALVSLPRAVTPKVLLHELYPYCGVVCPPVQYPVCQPLYPTDKPPTRRGSATNTPPVRSRTEDKKTYSPPQRPPEPPSIQHIKQHMSQLSTDGETRRDDKRDERRRDNGILGSQPTNDESQLTSTARAIVNSIRNMQAKSNYQPDGRNPTYRGRRHEDKRNRHEQFSHGTLAQVAPGNWCRRSPAPVYPVMNHPRRPHPNARNERR